MKKSILLLSAFFLLVIIVTRAQPVFRWVDALPGYSTATLPAANNIGTVIVNEGGDIYIGGTFVRGMDFDPGIGEDSLHSGGPEAGFWAKYDSSGHLLWAHSLSNVVVKAAFIDGNGNYYIAGSTSGTDSLGLGNSQISVSVTGGSDFLLAKYDASDHLLWVRHAGSGQSLTQIEAIKVDATGDIYVTGDFFGIVDFDPDNPGIHVRSSLSRDGFIARFDSNGNLIWVRQIRSINGVQGNGLDIDGLGNITITGSTGILLPPDSAFFEDSNQQLVSVPLYGQYDAFVAKYSANGSLLWSKTMGSALNDFGYCVTTDATGNIYLGGYYTDTFKIDAMALGSINPSNVGAYLVKLNASGNYVWSRFYGQDTGFNKLAVTRCLATDDSGYIYTSGSFTGTMILDSNQAAVTSHAAGANGQDAFVLKMDTSGNSKWAMDLYGKRDMAINSMLLDSHFNMCLGGYIVDSTDFNRGGTGGMVGFPTPNPNWIPVSFFAKYSQWATNGVHELAFGEQSISIYPNPARNHITAVGGVKSSDIVTVFDIIGHVCPATIAVQDGRIDIDTHLLQASTYILQIKRSGIRPVNIRFVKQ
jgi:hypothetical protein